MNDKTHVTVAYRGQKTFTPNPFEVTDARLHRPEEDQ